MSVGFSAKKMELQDNMIWMQTNREKEGEKNIAIS